MPTLTNPAIEINDEVIAVLPNTLRVKLGKGDKNVRAQTSGGNATSMVITTNAEMKKSSVAFSLSNENSNIDLVRAWQDAQGGNTIRLSEQDYILNFRNMHITTDPEWSIGADGSTEVTFEGPPSV